MIFKYLTQFYYNIVDFLVNIDVKIEVKKLNTKTNKNQQNLLENNKKHPYVSKIDEFVKNENCEVSK